MAKGAREAVGTAKKKAAAKSAPAKGTAKAKGAAANGSLESREKAVREVVYRSCLALDEMDFAAYLGLCHADFHYVISAYSPELRKEIIWLDHDKQGMTALFDVLPKHVSDNLLRLSLSRHVTVYTVDYDKGHTRATVNSALQVFTTTLDGGITALLGIAKLRDTIALDGGTAQLLSREVRLDTRMLGETGSHIPF